MRPGARAGRQRSSIEQPDEVALVERGHVSAHELDRVRISGHVWILPATDVLGYRVGPGGASGFWPAAHSVVDQSSNAVARRCGQRLAEVGQSEPRAAVIGRYRL